MRSEITCVQNQRASEFGCGQNFNVSQIHVRFEFMWVSNSRAFLSTCAQNSRAFRSYVCFEFTRVLVPRCIRTYLHSERACVPKSRTFQNSVRFCLKGVENSCSFSTRVCPKLTYTFQFRCVLDLRKLKTRIIIKLTWVLNSRALRSHVRSYPLAFRTHESFD